MVHSKRTAELNKSQQGQQQTLQLRACASAALCSPDIEILLPVAALRACNFPYWTSHVCDISIILRSQLYLCSEPTGELDVGNPILLHTAYPSGAF